jgi:hypothetical protein
VQFPPDAPSGKRELATGDATGSNLAGEIEALRATATMMREQIADLREDRDRWRGVAERLAIAPPVPSPTPSETSTPTAPVSWWRWLRTSG